MPTFDRSNLNFSFRIWIALAICFGCLFLLVLRLWFLQIIKGEYFRDRSENNRLRTIYIPSSRGLIYDRTGELLVRNRPSYNVELLVEDTPDPKQTIATLAEITGEDPALLYEKLTKQNRRRRFEPKLLIKDISLDMRAKISAQRYRLPGVIISVNPTREYIYGDLAAHLVGYIREINTEQLKNPAYSGYRMGDMVGQFGIESRLEQYLRGERGIQAVIVNAVGNKIGEAYYKPEAPGHNVELTVDRKVQEAAVRALGGRTGAVVALDPRNGDVLALVSSPTFDPNMFTGEISKEQYADLISTNKLTNRVVQGIYPPGSVFKIFVAIAALAEGVTNTTERQFCPGFLQFGRRAFRCHKHSGHGSVDLLSSIVQSCDVYFYVVGQRLSVDRIHEYATRFGFGETTQLDLAEESAGLIPSKQWKASRFRNTQERTWFPGETLPVAIGQGYVSATPLQVARGMAAVVNGGKVLRPRVLRKVYPNDGREPFIENTEPDVIRTVDIDSEILMEARNAMVGVVSDKRGTGHRAALPAERGISVAGKTGTSQVTGRDSGVKEEDHAWFAGYAPADNPEIVVVAIVENSGHGGAVAAPVVREVMAAHFGVEEPQAVSIDEVAQED